MGIYGWLAKKLVANQNEQILESNELIIEMEVNKSFIDFIESEQEILQEDIQANIDLKKDNKTKVTIMIRDRETVKSDKGCKHVYSCSYKVIGPDKLLDKAGGDYFDIIVPGYENNKSKDELKPYVDKAVSDKFKKTNPPELQLALDFGEKERKLLKLIYDNPASPNQKKLFRQLIKDCSKYYDVRFRSTDKDLDQSIQKNLK